MCRFPGFLFLKMMKKSDCFLLGRIVKVNKKTAEVIIATDVDDPTAHVDNEVLFIEIDGGLVPFFTSQMELSGDDTYRLFFEDWGDPVKAQRLVGCKTFLPLTKLTALQDDQFYYHDLIGFHLTDKKLGNIGTIAEIFETPEQTLLQVFFKETEILIPLADDFFVSINKAKKRLTLDLPDGLIDLYLDS